MSEMDALTDAFRVMEEWNERLVVGTGQQITDFILESERLLPSAWRRDRGREAQYAVGGEHPGSVCYIRSPRPEVEVSLWLLRIGDALLLNGVVDSTDRQRYSLDVAEAAREFETVVLFPAAAASGARVTADRPGPRSIVPGVVMDNFLAFLADGPQSWPLADKAAAKWRRFVISVCRSETLFDLNEFRGWLGSVGWTDAQAARLVEELTGDAQLLSEFKDELQIA